MAGRWSDLVEQVDRNRTKVLGVTVGALMLVGLLALPAVDSGSDTERLDASDRRGEQDSGPDDDLGVVERTTTSEAREGTAESDGEGATSASGGERPGESQGGTLAPAPGGGADPGTEAGGAVDTGNTRGVADDAIRIGVAVPDLGAFGNLSDEFDIGDVREQMAAVLDGWKRSGRLPVHGRTIEFAYRDFDILSSEEKVAACQGLVQEEKVFAVVAGRFFGEGAECVTERFDTPLVTLDSVPSDVYARAAPYYFTLRPAYEPLFTRWMHWAHESKLLEGKRIGLFYDQDVTAAVEAGVKNVLEGLGYTITEEVVAEGAGIGSQQDQIAVQRFRQRQVDLVIPVVGGSSLRNFTTTAEGQGYRPDYIDTDYGSHTTDTATSVYPPEQWDGTAALTTTRTGEIRAGAGPSPAAAGCIENYERYSGKEIGHRSPESAEYDNILISCDLAESMYAGIANAGRALGHATVIGGLEAIDGLPLARHGNLSYTAQRHYGVNEARPITWSKSCTCWSAAGGFRPL